MNLFIQSMNNDEPLNINNPDKVVAFIKKYQMKLLYILKKIYKIVLLNNY